jgi:hypothetical protein
MPPIGQRLELTFTESRLEQQYSLLAARIKIMILIVMYEGRGRLLLRLV